MGDFTGSIQGQAGPWDSGDGDDGVRSGFLSAAGLASVMLGVCLW